MISKARPGKLDHVAIDLKRDRLFVANKANNTLDVVDLKTGKLLQQVPGQAGIQGVAYVADLDRVYVGLGSATASAIFSTAQPIQADQEHQIRRRRRQRAVRPPHAYGFRRSCRKDARRDRRQDLRSEGDIKLPGTAEGFEAEKNSSKLFLNVPDTNEVVVIDTGKKEITGTYPLKLAGANHPLALDEANHRIFVGCHKEPKVVVLDSETGKEITSVAIPEGCDDLFFDAKHKRVYVSCSEGYLVTISQKDPDHYEVIEKLPTAKDARTCVFVPEQDKVYLAVPRQEGKQGPEIRVYDVKP